MKTTEEQKDPLYLGGYVDGLLFAWNAFKIDFNTDRFINVLYEELYKNQETVIKNLKK